MTQRYTIKECLRGYTTDALGEICSLRQLAVTTRDSRIRAIEKILRDPLHVQRSVKSLNDSALRALNLVAERGEMAVTDLAAVPGLYGERDPIARIESLVKTGLLLIMPEQSSGAFSVSHIKQCLSNGVSSPMLSAPEEIARHLPPAPPLGVELPAAEGPDVPTKPAALNRATTEFLETLRIIENLAPRVTSANTLHKTDAAKAVEMAREADLSREAMEISLAMARELGCVVVKEGRLKTTEKANEWASASRAARMRTLFEAYLATEELPDVKLFFPMLFASMEEHLPRGAQRRTYHKVLAAQLLHEQRPAVWYSIGAFVEAIRRLDSNVLFLEEGWRAIQANARGSGSAWRQQAWQAHEKRLFTWMLKSLLSGFGMVQISEDGALFRITEVGQFALGEGEAPDALQDDRHDALVVQPDFEIIAYLDRCPPDLRRKLDMFCERVRAGMATTYRLTQESVYHGVCAGLDVDRLIQLLREASAKPLPSNVLTQFDVWKTKLSAVTIRRSCDVVECASAAQAKSLAASLSDAERKGDRFILLNGHAPEVTSIIDYTHALPPALEQMEGLRLHAHWEDATLFLRHRLTEIGDVEVNGTGSGITVSLCRSRVATEEDSALLVAQIEALAKQPLAARYRLALRAWAGEVGEALSRNAVVVRFEDAETCEAVLQAPGLAEHVEGRLGLYAIVVRQGRLAAFKRILKDHGVKVVKSSDIVDPTPPEKWAVEWVEQQGIEEHPADAAGKSEPGGAEQGEAPAPAPLPSYPPRVMREILEEAISDRRPVLINYQSAWSARPTTRQLNPVALDISGSSPSVSGYCHQHGGARSFKLARITGIRLLEDETF